MRGTQPAFPHPVLFFIADASRLRGLMTKPQDVRLSAWDQKPCVGSCIVRWPHSGPSIWRRFGAAGKGGVLWAAALEAGRPWEKLQTGELPPSCGSLWFCRRVVCPAVGWTSTAHLDLQECPSGKGHLESLLQVRGRPALVMMCFFKRNKSLITELFTYCSK